MPSSTPEFLKKPLHYRCDLEVNEIKRRDRFGMKVRSLSDIRNSKTGNLERNMHRKRENQNLLGSSLKHFYCCFQFQKSTIQKFSRVSLFSFSHFRKIFVFSVKVREYFKFLNFFVLSIGKQAMSTTIRLIQHTNTSFYFRRTAKNVWSSFGRDPPGVSHNRRSGSELSCSGSRPSKNDDSS